MLYKKGCWEPCCHDFKPGHTGQTSVRVCPEDLLLRKHLCIPYTRQRTTLIENKMSDSHLSFIYKSRVHPRQHFKLQPVPRHPRMTIRLELPFPFTFLRLKGATCSGPVLAVLTKHTGPWNLNWRCGEQRGVFQVQANVGNADTEAASIDNKNRASFCSLSHLAAGLLRNSLRYVAGAGGG